MSINGVIAAETIGPISDLRIQYIISIAGGIIMAQIFLSYTSFDFEIAKNTYTILCNMGYSVWFAPRKIPAGASYTHEIAKELIKDEMDIEDEEANLTHLNNSKALILLLSEASMHSKWVSRELNKAINNDIYVLPLKIDHAPITEQFQFKLDEIQWIEAFHLNEEFFISTVSKELHEHGIDPNKADYPHSVHKEREMLSAFDLGIRSISSGDPYFIYGDTLQTSLSNYEFFLTPPTDTVELTESQIKWVKEHFALESKTFGLSWDELLMNIPIPDLKERIEQSRLKVFQHFLHQKNGCYFNNLKYGINSINRFGRTEDLSERPVLSIEFFTTDYYTHRVMKDVCKTLISEGNDYLSNISFDDMTFSRIFFTSLGINLILLDDSLKPDKQLLITSRSKNAAEADWYKKKTQSVSVVEGVSLSDKDSYTENVNLVFAVERGLLEELGVKTAFLNKGTLRFYDLFMNRFNLEMGLSCSIELLGSKSVKTDVLPLHAKDEELETAHKKCVPVKDLREYFMTNRDSFMEQAAYTICKYLDATGEFILRRFTAVASHKEKMVMSKAGPDSPCGDAIIETKDFIAVIDGATPKGIKLWEGMRGDVYITKIIGDAILKMERNILAPEAIKYINNCVSEAYIRNGTDFESLPLSETLQASIIIYSHARHEVWSFGDCLLRINQRDYSNVKQLDILMSNLRAYFIEIAKIKGLYHYNASEEDYGRNCIQPFLKEQGIFANSMYSFGYNVINGGPINEENVKIYSVQSGDRVIMATDGYPRLMDTIAESEEYLARGLKNDPDCVYELRSTKGVHMGNSSFDDRAYIGFTLDSDN